MKIDLPELDIPIRHHVCGVCLKEFGRKPTCRMNGVLVHGYCYAKAMEFFRMLTILSGVRVDKLAEEASE